MPMMNDELEDEEELFPEGEDGYRALDFDDSSRLDGRLERTLEELINDRLDELEDAELRESVRGESDPDGSTDGEESEDGIIV